MAGTARRVMRLLQKRGLQDEDDPLAEDDPLLATLMAASVRSRIATGPEAGQPWHRLGDRVEPIEPDGGGTIQKSDAPPRCVREGGMSLHADITIPAHDRMRLERLSRYILRPPVTLDRLEAQPDGRLAYRLKTPWRDGTTHILMERHELLERLAPLIPPPRAHQTRYYGILAPCASGRSQVVPSESGASAADDGGGIHATVAASRRADGPDHNRSNGAADEAAPGKPETANGPNDSVRTQTNKGTKPHDDPEPLTSRPAPKRRSSRIGWSDLLKRIFGVEALRCPCGQTMRVLAAITDPAVAKRILVCMSLPSRAPPLEPANLSHYGAEPWLEDHAAADFDQTPTWDESSQAT
jgi:hypothetical protein